MSRSKKDARIFEQHIRDALKGGKVLNQAELSRGIGRCNSYMCYAVTSHNIYGKALNNLISRGEVTAVKAGKSYRYQLELASEAPVLNAPNNKIKNREQVPVQKAFEVFMEAVYDSAKSAVEAEHEKETGELKNRIRELEAQVGASKGTPNPLLEKYFPWMKTNTPD